MVALQFNIVSLLNMADRRPMSKIKTVAGDTRSPGSPAKKDSAIQLPAQQCRRPCPSHIRHRNIIYFGFDWPPWDVNRAGIADRFWLLSIFSNMAGYYCAKVYLDKPHELLEERHNNGVQVSSDLTWEDLGLSWRFHDDNTSTIMEMGYHEPDPHVVVTKLQQLLSKANKNKKATLVLSTESVEQFPLHLDQIHRFSQQQLSDPDLASSTFIWSIEPVWFLWEEQYVNFFKSKPEEAFAFPFPVTDCEYVTFHGSSFLESMTADLMELIKQTIPAEKYGLIHIRRGDAIEECDTSLPKLAKYIACSFQGTEQGDTTYGLLLSSDEKDPCYRKAVSSIVENVMGGHVKFLDLDITTQSFLDERIQSNPKVYPHKINNNYFLFQLQSMYFKSGMSFNLKQRRSIQCDDCNPILQKTEEEIGAFLQSVSLDISSIEAEYQACIAQS